MTNKVESIFAVLAALLVVFTAMLNTWVSIGIAVTLLVALAIYKFVKR